METRRRKDERMDRKSDGIKDTTTLGRSDDWME